MSVRDTNDGADDVHRNWEGPSPPRFWPSRRNREGQSPPLFWPSFVRHNAAQVHLAPRLDGPLHGNAPSLETSLAAVMEQDPVISSLAMDRGQEPSINALDEISIVGLSELGRIDSLLRKNSANTRASALDDVD